MKVFQKINRFYCFSIFFLRTVREIGAKTFTVKTEGVGRRKFGQRRTDVKQGIIWFLFRSTRGLSGILVCFRKKSCMAHLNRIEIRRTWTLNSKEDTPTWFCLGFFLFTIARPFGDVFFPFFLGLEGKSKPPKSCSEHRKPSPLGLNRPDPLWVRSSSARSVGDNWGSWPQHIAAAGGFARFLGVLAARLSGVVGSGMSSIGFPLFFSNGFSRVLQLCISLFF